MAATINTENAKVGDALPRLVIGPLTGRTSSNTPVRRRTSRRYTMTSPSWKRRGCRMWS